MSSAEIRNFYSSAQRGGELPYFVGKQYGSGWLKTLGRFALPILRRIGGVAMKTASDVINKDASILPTLTNYAMEEVNKTGILDAFKKPDDRTVSTGGSTGGSTRKRSGPSHISINKRRKLLGKTIFKRK